MKVLKCFMLLLIACSLPALSKQSEQVEQAIAKINQGHYTGIDGLIIYQDNLLIAEHYFNGFDNKQLHQTRSTFKSISGLLAAIAFDKNLLDPDEKLQPLISQNLKVEVSDRHKSKITIKDVLHMTSGLDCSEMPGTGPYHEEMVDDGPTPLKYSLSIAMANKPGDKWQYCNANSFLLGAAISAALKRAKQPDIFEFAKEQLFKPLGISQYRIYQSPDGFLYAQGNARFKPMDLAKLGLLVLNKGQWHGRQIISPKHIETIFAGYVQTHWSWTKDIKDHTKSKARYAYQWYRTEFESDQGKIPVSHSWGNGGQFIFVAPTLDSVFVLTGSNYGNIDKQKQAFEIMHKHLLPAIQQKTNTRKIEAQRL